MDWTKLVRCKKCKSVFVMEEEDLMIYFNPDKEKTKRFVRCPECFENIKLEVTNDKTKPTTIFRKNPNVDVNKKTE